MSKFFVLLKKELREMLTVQTMVSMLVGAAIFVLLGFIIGNSNSDAEKNAGNILLIDRDNSALSASVTDFLSSSGITVTKVDPTDAVDPAKAADDYGFSSVYVIPEGFGSSILNDKQPSSLQVVTRLKNFSLASLFSLSPSTQISAVVNEFVSNQLISSAAEGDVAFLKNPVTTEETTVVGSAQAAISPTALSGVVLNQSIIIPIVVFVLVMFASQMTSSAIANEKGDKTLETLLSTPVSRVSVLLSKMLASSLVALLMAVVYMFGFSGYMNSITGGAGTADSMVSSAMQSLGLQLSIPDYILVGVHLFLTILIGLSVATILGALSEDIKSAQTTIFPLMFAILIPYLLSMFLDLGSMPLLLQLLVYAIPFTHTFLAMNNLMFGNDLLVYGGILYQLLFLAVCMFIAVRIFSSDKIFTMKISMQHKKAFAPKK